MKDVYQDFVTKFLSVIDFVAPNRTLKVKSNTKSWFDIDVLNDSGNPGKHRQKFKRSGKEIDKDNFKCAKLFIFLKNN